MCCLLLVVCCVEFGLLKKICVGSWLFVDCCLLFVASTLLFAVFRLVCIVCCVLRVV